MQIPKLFELLEALGANEPPGRAVEISAWNCWQAFRRDPLGALAEIAVPDRGSVEVRALQEKWTEAPFRPRIYAGIGRALSAHPEHPGDGSEASLSRQQQQRGLLALAEIAFAVRASGEPGGAEEAARWIQSAVVSWSGEQPDQDATTTAPDMDALLAELAPLPVGMLRDAAAALAAGEPAAAGRPAERERRACILHGDGHALELVVELVPRGRGELYPHPARMLFRLEDDALLGAVDSARNHAVALARELRGEDCFPTVSDIRWWVDDSTAAGANPALDGSSLGAAAATAMTHLLLDTEIDPGCAIAAVLGTSGAMSGAVPLQSVDDIRPKVEAAIRRGLRRIVVHPGNLERARQAAAGAGHPAPDVLVHAAETLRQAWEWTDSPRRALLLYLEGVQSLPGRGVAPHFHRNPAELFVEPDLRELPTSAPFEPAPELLRPRRRWADEEKRWRGPGCRGAVYVGVPGAGKTLLLRATAARLGFEARKFLARHTGGKNGPVPVFLSGPALVTGSLQAAVEAAAGALTAASGTSGALDASARELARELIWNRVEAGQAWLFVDGPEFPSGPSAVMDGIAASVDRGSRLFLAARNRESCLWATVSIPGLLTYELAEFSPAQQEQLIRNWCSGSPRRAEEWAAHLRAESAWDVCGNPFTLTLACAAWEGGAGGPSPGLLRPAALFDRITSEILGPDAPPGDRLLLRAVSWSTLRGELPAEGLPSTLFLDLARREFPGERLKRFEDCLERCLRSGFLVLQPGGRWGFLHRRFREYLAAEYLADELNAGARRPDLDRATALAHHEHGRQVLRFLTPLLSDPAPLLNRLCPPDLPIGESEGADLAAQHRLAAAMECLAELQPPGRPEGTTARVTGLLLETWLSRSRRHTTAAYARLASALPSLWKADGRFRGEPVRQWLRRQLDVHEPADRILALRLAGALGPAAASSEIVEKVLAISRWRPLEERRWAAWAAAQMGAAVVRDPDARRRLLELLAYPEPSVRASAQELVESLGEAAACSEFVRGLLQLTTKREPVARAALRALGHAGPAAARQVPEVGEQLGRIVRAGWNQPVRRELLLEAIHAIRRTGVQPDRDTRAALRRLRRRQDAEIAEAAKAVLDPPSSPDGSHIPGRLPRAAVATPAERARVRDLLRPGPGAVSSTDRIHAADAAARMDWTGASAPAWEDARDLLAGIGPGLVAMLGSSNRDERRAAARALGTLQAAGLCLREDGTLARAREMVG